MTPEERFERIERQLEFLATHQANLTASVEMLLEAERRHSEQIAQHSAQIEQHSAQIEQHSAQIGQHSSQIGDVLNLVLRLARVVEEQGRQVDASLKRLVEAQKRTDDRLRALIGVVERHFSNDHGE